ncbi:hypothetical protein CAPTEDRAFT_187094, partial [Capitella teleta]
MYSIYPAGNILGDQNIGCRNVWNRFENAAYVAVQWYKLLLHENNLIQLVNVPTHVSKNTLDHVCKREADTAPGVISDHILLLFNIAIMRQKRRKKITYRRWATLDKQVFAENVTIGLSRIPPSNSCSHPLQRLTDVCTDVLDTLVPRKSKQIEPREGRDQHTDCSEDSMIVSFLMVTDEDVEKLIRQLPLKQYSLDSLPTWLVKEQALLFFAPVLTGIINTSLKNGE